MSGIQRNTIVLVIAISFWGVCMENQDNHGTSNALASERCSDRSPEYKKAGFVAYDAFNDLVNISMNDPSMDITPYMDTYNKSLTDFLKTSYKYCSVDNQTITTENYTDYLTVVKFSLLNSTVLKELEENGAFGCILANKPNIDHCIEEYVEENITLHNNYSQLHIKSYLNFNSVACKRTKDVKTCVLKVLKDNKCFMATEYVTSLFDFVYSNYCNDIPAESSNAPVNITGHWSFFVMVSLWTALVLNRSWFN